MTVSVFHARMLCSAGCRFIVATDGRTGTSSQLRDFRRLRPQLVRGPDASSLGSRRQGRYPWQHNHCRPEQEAGELRQRSTGPCRSDCHGSGDVSACSPPDPMATRAVRWANTRPIGRPSSPTPVTSARLTTIDFGERRRSSPVTCRGACETRFCCAPGEIQRSNQRRDLFRAGVALRDLYHGQFSQGNVAVFAVRRRRSLRSQHVE